MRDTHAWRQSLRAELRQAWPTVQHTARPASHTAPNRDRAPSGGGVMATMGPDELLDVELGLTALSLIAPGERAEALFTLLRGYPVGQLAMHMRTWSQRERQALGVARQALAHLKSRYTWRAALTSYRRVDEALRGYSVADDLGTFDQRPVTVAARRFDIYERTLSRPLPYTRRALPIGPAGASYRFREGSRDFSIRVPETSLPRTPRGHDLTGAKQRAPFKVTRRDLIETARWMDATLNGHYETVIAQLQLRLFDADRTHLSASESLEISGLMHLVGMLGAGKSTLMEVIAVCAARRGLRVTLVVGDVMGALDRLDRFSRLGLAASPMLSSVNRPRHLRQLRRAMEARLARGASLPSMGGGAPISELARERFDHAGYAALGVACPLDALADIERPRPFALGREPCRTLRTLPMAQSASQRHPRADSDSAETAGAGEDVETADSDALDALDGLDALDAGAAVGCPLYAGCPRRQVERQLVDARIWLATPASLVYTSVPNELNGERLRMAELVFRASDLLIVDEADAVQVQLDNMFCPTQPLTGDVDGADAWLDTLNAHLATLRPHQDTAKAQRAPAEWSHALHAAMIATEQIYTLLQDPESRNYLDRLWVSYEYFSEWSLLQRRLAHELAGVTSPMGEARSDDTAEPDADAQARIRHFTDLFDLFSDDRLGARGEARNTLAAVAEVLLANNNADQQYDAIDKWLATQRAHTRYPQEAHEAMLVRLRFALLVALLSQHLSYLTNAWRQVEAALLLDSASLAPLQRPPGDFTAVLPDAPMGNILGYQFLPSREGGAGSLRFLRCQGVGRALLLRFSDLFPGDGLAGPNTLLLSGTSWAGASPSYHVQAPVAGILDMPEKERDALRRSVFTFRHYPRQDDPGRSIAVSGQYGADREQALGALLARLAAPDPFNHKSALERERDSLPPGRQRLLLVVGSYEEARIAYTHLLALRPDWDDASALHALSPVSPAQPSATAQIAFLTPDDDPSSDADDDLGWRSPAANLERYGARRGARRNPGGLPRGQVSRFSETNAWILIAPLKAIERGHNILNDQDQAALGAVYFLVRPHERPDDIAFAVHTMNRFAMEAIAEPIAKFTAASAASTSGARGNVSVRESHNARRVDDRWARLDLAAAGARFSEDAYRRWHGLLRRQLIYTTATPDEREALVWNQLVPIWQVIGRLVRGGAPARVYFCDARFAPARASGLEQPDTAATSLLVAMRGALAPYFATEEENVAHRGDRSSHSSERDQAEHVVSAAEAPWAQVGLPLRAPATIPPDERALVRALYEPLYVALCNVKGL